MCASVALPRIDDDRAEPITRLIGQRVAALRGAGGMTQGELGERMAGLRSGWSRSTVVKLENNKRESLSVGDLLCLAIALDVPPVVLVADPRTPGAVPVAEGLEVDQWEALLWMIGAGTIDIANSGRTFTAAAWLIHAGIGVAEALAELRKVDRGVDAKRAQTRTDDRHRSALEAMHTALIRISAQGAPIPNLPPWVYDRAAELGVDLPGVDG